MMTNLKSADFAVFPTYIYPVVYCIFGKVKSTEALHYDIWPNVASI